MTTKSLSKFDSIYRNILLGKFFTKGWGNPQNMKRYLLLLMICYLRFWFVRIFQFRKIISNRETCKALVQSNYPVYIDSKIEQNSSFSVYDGHLLSPLVQFLPDLVPKEAQIARFQLILPNQWANNSIKPMCLHFAGTGDHVNKTQYSNKLIANFVNF